MDLQNIALSVRADLDEKNKARERGLTSSRSAIRACGNAIRALHRHEIEGARGLLEEAQGHLDDARDALAAHSDILYAGFVQDAEKELAEARITHALITEAPFPTPEELGLETAPYLKGMAEAIGELRRHILDLMRQGDLERCESLLGAMDDIYFLLVSMDYPDGITLGLRRLTDVARSIIERTRGDFTTSTIQNSLRDALTEHASTLQDR